MVRDSQSHSGSWPPGLRDAGTGVMSHAVTHRQNRLTKGQFSIRVMARQGMFPLKHDNMLHAGLILASDESGQVMHEASDMLFCGKVVDGHCAEGGQLSREEGKSGIAF